MSIVSENKSIKILLIVVNVVIWGYAAIELIPLLLGDKDAAPAPRPGKQQRQPTAARRTDNRQTRRDGPPRRSAAGTPGRERPNIWQQRQPLTFFASVKDPFMPFLIPAGGGGSTAAARRDTRRVIDWSSGGRRSDKPRPVTTIYRLSGITVIKKDGQKTYKAILTSGGGEGGADINVTVGQQLPGGEVVKEINIKKNYVLLAKKGHLFKLVDYAPWVYKIK